MRGGHAERMQLFIHTSIQNTGAALTGFTEFSGSLEIIFACCDDLLLQLCQHLIGPGQAVQLGLQ